MGKIYCYIRISTDKQEYDRQIQIFKERALINGVNCEYVEETFTGTAIRRPKFDELIEKMESGDTLICESLSRLSRGGVIKTLDLITDFIQNKKINVTILKENFDLKAGEKPDANTNLLLGIFSVLGQFERDLISERTIEGMRARKASGVTMGRPVSPKHNMANFKRTLSLIVTDHLGQDKAAIYTGYPRHAFKLELKKLYNKYNTKDYKEILEKLEKEEKESEEK